MRGFRSRGFGIGDAVRAVGLSPQTSDGPLVYDVDAFLSISITVRKAPVMFKFWKFVSEQL